MSLAWKHRRRVRPRLVLLLDVSRSMSLYSFFYLRLARALCAELADVHCFIFHTRITGVSDALRDPNPKQAQDRLHILSSGWAGGTRIGESLAGFNRDHAARLVHSRTAVIIVSDGYDTGEPEVLAKALGDARAARAAHRLAQSAARHGRDSRRRVAACRRRCRISTCFAPGADLASIERALPKILDALS